MRRTAATTMLLPLLLAGCEQGALETESGSPGFARLDHELSFTTIHVPGATLTNAQGISASGDIVGWYVHGGVTRGFLLSDGEFTTIEFPGAAYTDARGIAANGDIVGNYRLPGEPGLAFHGYRRTSAGEMVPVRYPGHTYEILQRILPDGTILGCRHDNDLMASMRGIAIGRSGHSETDAFASMHNGGTPDGRRIAGLYTNMQAGGRGEGYLIENGTFTPLLFPGSVNTSAWDMNPAGEIVGNYRDAEGRNRAFLYRRGEWVSIDVPGATVTRAFGINAAGDIVGVFVAEGVTRGYIARRGMRGGR